MTDDKTEQTNQNSTKQKETRSLYTEISKITEVYHDEY